MKAMLLKHLSDLNKEKNPLDFEEVPEPVPGQNEILIKVNTCGVCHTELDEIEGRTPPPFFPVIPGHQVVGRVEGVGKEVTQFKVGDRAGVAWIFSSCGTCEYCTNGLDNLCPEFLATGRDANGGYAQYMKVHEDFAYPISEYFTDEEAAPLFCAGAIGYRSLKLANIKNGQLLGLTGFGASAHLVLKLSRHIYPDTDVMVFARNEKERAFARDLGAAWAGDIGENAPEKLTAIIDTTPVWKPILSSLENLNPGGRLVINAIRKEEGDKSQLLSLNYTDHLWMEKEVKSVANVARKDVSEFLKIAAKAKIKPEIQTYPLQDANKALIELKERKIKGAKVLAIHK
jgi:propanol-preferring alcohol dehydrogenase